MTHTSLDKPSELTENLGDSSGGFLAAYGVKTEAELLERAFTHRSWSAENNKAPHNERLEFLGDSVLGIAITDKLYKTFPDMVEGQLAKRRAAIVSTTSLASAARRIGLGKFLRLGKGEDASGGREKDSILADTLEAVIGAVYLANDAAVAIEFVLQVLAPEIAEGERLALLLDPKTTLQEIAARHKLAPPKYSVSGTGPDHNRSYTATVSLLGVTARGEGSSKKNAELNAAARAVSRLTAQNLAG